MSQARLCPELQPLLDAELAAGNRIGSTGPTPGEPEGTLVLLAGPLRTGDLPLSPAVARIPVNDPHWWKEELRCTLHRHAIASPFP
jgi:hypothetical protein